MGKTFTQEKAITVWDDDTGFHITVGEDGDGLGLMRLKAVESGGEVLAEFDFRREMGPLLADGLHEVAEHLEMRERDEAMGKE